MLLCFDAREALEMVAPDGIEGIDGERERWNELPP